MQTTHEEPLTGQRVREIRLALGLSQDKFAWRIRVSVNTVKRWEYGKSTPTVGSVIAALRAAEREAFGDAEGDGKGNTFYRKEASQPKTG